MSERYTRVFSAGENLYTVGCPIIISAAVLLKDNTSGKVLAQLKLKNVFKYNQPVISVTVGIQPLDVAGNPLGSEVDYQYLDISIERNEEFGQKTPIYLPDSTSRGFYVRVKRIVFGDGKAATNNGDAYFRPIPGQQPLESFIEDSICLKQYIYEHGSNCSNAPLEYKDIWICCCGGVNRKDDNNCCGCSSSKDSVFNISLDELRNRYNEREQIKKQKEIEEEERRRKQKLEEENRKRQEEEAQRRKKRRILKIVSISGGSCVLAVGLLLAIFLYFIPLSKYNAAEKLLEEEKYEEAESAFGEIDFKDSEQKAQEAFSRAETKRKEEQKRKEEEEKRIQNDKIYNEKMEKAKQELGQWQYDKMLTTISEISGEGFESHYSEIDKFLVDFVKKALVKDMLSQADKALAMIHDASITEKDSEYQMIVNSYNSYVKIIELCAIDTKEEIKKVNSYLSDIKIGVKGVKELKKLFKRYKDYLGFYKSKKKALMLKTKYWIYCNISIHMNKEETKWGVYYYSTNKSLNQKEVDEHAKTSDYQHEFNYPKKQAKDFYNRIVLKSKNTLYDYYGYPKKQFVCKRIKS